MNEFIKTPLLSRRVLLTEAPFSYKHLDAWTVRGVWPSRWIWHPDATQTPVVCAFRLPFFVGEDTTCRLHVSADERYELFLDGQLIGRGPERGDPDNWFYESYDLALTAGEHMLVAKVWALGDKAPFAQMSLRPGFLLAPDDSELQTTFGTGSAPWETKVLGGYEWLNPLCGWGTGWNQSIRGEAFDWGYELGEGENWGTPVSGVHGANVGSQQEVRAHHRMHFATLPPMLDEPRSAGQVHYVAPWENRPVADNSLHSNDALPKEVIAWQKLLDENVSHTIEQNTKRRVLIDVGDYICARPHLLVSGGLGSQIDVHWSEGLYEDTETWRKGHRDEWNGKIFSAYGQRLSEVVDIGHMLDDGPGDTFWPDGGENRNFSTLWWQSGRFIQVLIETADEPLTLHELGLRETGYPLEIEASFSSSDKSVDALAPMMVRTLQMCAHESYMDCPFFEQIMYVGDTRLQVLLTYVLTRDERLPKKALQLLDWSRVQNGLTQSRYPSRVLQLIPPYSLWWIAMVHDYALWRDDAAFVRSLLPGVRAVCDHFAALIGEDGLMKAPNGWNFTDYVRTTDEEIVGDDPNWRHGTPPNSAQYPSGVLNWHAALIFKQASELESWYGESQLADLQSQRAHNLSHAVDTFFWDENRGLYADDLAHEYWSEHSQCLALLSGLVPDEKQERLKKGLIEAPDLTRTTIYFMHYLFETYRLLGRMDTFFERLKGWDNLVENGLKTTIELPEPTRSDCHAWGAHPLFHYFATLAGIRPVAPGVAEVEINPQLGHLQWLEARLPHPKGMIHVRAQKDSFTVELPEGVSRRAT